MIYEYLSAGMVIPSDRPAKDKVLPKVILRSRENYFFAQSALIKLALPKAAQLGIFCRKISSVAPPQGT